ncbi:hypothetical protein HY620_00605 [Candidatus Uhrbacteria bacterium]|nr:hypothetical protein [Candidatus Uhrbacteria bacterium]
MSMISEAFLDILAMVFEMTEASRNRARQQLEANPQIFNNFLVLLSQELQGTEAISGGGATLKNTNSLPHEIKDSERQLNDLESQLQAKVQQLKNLISEHGRTVNELEILSSSATRKGDREKTLERKSQLIGGLMTKLHDVCKEANVVANQLKELILTIANVLKALKEQIQQYLATLPQERKAQLEQKTHSLLAELQIPDAAIAKLQAWSA